MDRSEFSALLDQALNVVRVHGWVTQIHEPLRLVAGIGEANVPPREELQEVVAARLGQVARTEERLLCLVILKELRCPLPRVAELFFQALSGKIGKIDWPPILSYFFEGRSPIPAEIFAMVTERVFMTPHRAMFEIMQVESFESEFDPSAVALYLIQLLCRNDLFEQNRGMVYLLLSRIDAPMTPAMEARVQNALHDLKDIIDHVEAQGKKVRTESHPSPEAAVPSSTEGGTETPPPADTPSAGPPPQLEREPWRQPGWTGSPAAPSAPQARRSAPIPAGQPGDWTTAARSRTEAPLPGAGGPAARPAASLERPAATAASSAVPSAPTPAQPQAPRADLDRPARAAPRVVEDMMEAASRAGGRFRIEFNRVTEALRSLLEEFEVIAPPPGADPAEGSVRPPLAGTPQKRWPWLWMVLAVLLLGAAAAAILVFGQPARVAAPAVPLLAPVSADVGAPGDPTVERDGDRWIWRPQPGARLWDLYQDVNAGRARFPGSEKLANDWKEFLNAIQDKNPGLSVPDLIQPRQAIVLGSAAP